MKKSYEALTEDVYKGIIDEEIDAFINLKSEQKESIDKISDKKMILSELKAKLRETKRDIRKSKKELNQERNRLNNLSKKLNSIGVRINTLNDVFKQSDNYYVIYKQSKLSGYKKR